jgi:hypothetical protein
MRAKEAVIFAHFWLVSVMSVLLQQQLKSVFASITRSYFLTVATTQPKVGKNNCHFYPC